MNIENKFNWAYELWQIQIMLAHILRKCFIAGKDFYET